ncbi:cytochrome-c peroxidase [Edaphocola aurantiacus]|uniref:cytochrome-c peroxidase n=1 Tax=Edaphocola aurantiacus TaxID=2601682 RepID=UPI001C97BFCA|nr:cytochrome c peroxidase [Edaphocola aurantiacus]
MAIPKGFTQMSIPADNAFSMSRWQLGKRLFYDKTLSVNNTISCGSCHKASLAFSDSVALSNGVNEAAGTSNAPTLANVGYQTSYTRAGGVPTLEMQVLVPIQEHNEFNTSILDIVQKLSADTTYQSMAQEAYSRSIDPYVITRALACFERSLISGNSRFDQYYYQGKSNALSAEELQGMQLFFSERTNCSGCHSDFNFTNYRFENNGLYQQYSDSGRMRFTHLESDRARFKVPTLRNIAFTAPYMHDGSISSLEAVIEHYNSGGVAHPNKSALIRPLQLSPQEKASLVAFLKSLSDYTFIRNKKFKNE